MHIVRSTALVLAAFAVIVFGYAHTTARPEPTASAYPLSRSAVCASQAPHSGALAWVRKLGASGLTWQYVTGPEARYFHISRCSVAIVGTNRYGSDASVIITPRGKVVAQS